MSTDEKRAELREKIEAGEKRNEERALADRARDAAESATEFVKAHPFATLGGAIAIGLAIGAMTRPGRRVARRGGVLATLFADAALAYGMQAIDRAGDLARDGQDKLEDLGESMAAGARSARRDTAYFADKAADRTGVAARSASRKAGRTVRNLRSRITH